MNDIRERIKSDEIDKTVNAEKQNRHIRGAPEYVEGRSYLLDGIRAQELVDRYHGTGRLGMTRFKDWNNKETIISDNYIGVDVDQDTKIETPTMRFKIHYSKTGTHIVPTIRE